MKLFFTSLVSLLFLATVVAQKLTVRADSWFPYNDEPNAAAPGYVVELLREIFSAENIEVDYQLMPWSRALAEVNRNAIDAVIGAMKSDAPDALYPQEPCGISSSSFFVKEGSVWRYKGPASLEKIYLGVMADYSYGEEIDAYIAKHKDDAKRLLFLTGDAPLVNGINMLRRGRLDAVIEDDNVFRARAQQMGFEGKDFINAGVTSSDPIYVAFAPGKPESKRHAELWDKGVAKLRASGKLAELLKRYSVTDWKK